jgi:TorA maturation chaperone TorD
MATADTLEQVVISEEDALRAQMYRLLGYFLQKPADADALKLAAKMEGDETPLGTALSAFSRIASKSDPSTISNEYHELFIGVGRGELLPYASYYLTGFLHEKPLAKLRIDMSRLGIERRETVREPEDHIAALCEMMCGMITGEFGDAASLDEQKQFFDEHVGSWAKHFFTDLEGAKSSVLYGALGSIGKAYIEIEQVAFTMD